MEQVKSGIDTPLDKGGKILETSNEMLQDILGDAGEGIGIKEIDTPAEEIEELLSSKSSKAKKEDEEIEDIIEKSTKPKSEIKNEQPELDDVINEDDVDSLGDYEPAIAEFFVNKFAEELELELDEESKPKSISEVTEFIKNLVVENSKPVYPNDKVEKLAEFVANGGKFEEFYDKTVVGRINIDDVDLDDETHQKAVLKEHLINNLGFKESAASKKIQRWEDAGMLAEEAEEALEAVKEFRVEQEKLLLENQRKINEENKSRQQKFISDVESSIKQLNSIGGYTISDKEKKELNQYILKVDSDGYTPYQKDYTKSVQHLIESAYFIKNRDKFVKKIEKQAETSAVKKLKQTLSSGKGVRGVVENTDNDVISTLASLGSQFLPRK